MAKARRTIVFTQHKNGTQKVTRPAAVFPNWKAAVAYKAQLSAAHKTGDVKAVKDLDENVPLTETGTLFSDTKFALTEVPYAPGIAVPETADDAFTL